MDKALDFINKYIDDGVVIACSGGPDSMALFDVLLKSGLKNIVCAHVNHKVRTESDSEAIMVKNFCLKNKIPFELYEISEYSGINFEAEAREKRYMFFESVLKKYKYKNLLTAHHGDDLMETILYRLVRGSSLEGYAGFKYISERENYTIFRPLVWYSKDEIMEYVKKNNIPYAIDSSNNNTDYLRNKFRHKVLPVYKEINKDAHIKFLQFSNILNKYDNFINSYIDKIYPSIVNDEINIPLLLKEDELIIDNIIYKYLVNISDNINTRHIEFVKKVISSSKKNVIINLPGITLERKYNKLGVFKEKSNYLYELNNYVKLDSGYIIKKIEDTTDNSNYVCKLDSKEINLPLHVRNYNKGDRINIKNSYNKKVSDIFIDNKISDRNSFPIVLDSSNNILWLPGVKKSKFCKTKDEKYDIILLYCLEEENEK